MGKRERGTLDVAVPWEQAQNKHEVCLFQKERSRRTKLGAICVKTKTKTQKQKTHIQKLKNRRTKIKNKKNS